MNTPTSTQEHISRLIGFRQAVYANIFQQRRDALFEMLDALLCGGTLPSFAYLSQHERFRRKWHSLYVAVEDGQIDTCALRQLLVQQLPQEGVCVFPLDSSCWSRPRSRVLEDLQYVYQASSTVNGGTVSIGYPYSLLEWCAEPHTSWSLPLDVRRMDSQHTAQDVGAEQVRALAQAREGCSQALDIVVADGKYGNAGFLSCVSGLRVGIVARLRSDRMFYRPAEPTSGRRGRPPKYGERFDCQEEQTWGEPDEVLEFVDEQYGKVCLKRWKGLRDKRAPTLTFDLVRAETHLEKDRPPAALWLVWLPPVHPPAHIPITAQTIWTAYSNRWTVEAGIRFRKEALSWTLPRFQSAQTGDTWTQLVVLAHWMLLLARPVVQDSPLAWQKAQTRLTPQRVRQSLWTILMQIGTPAQPPKLPENRLAGSKAGAGDAKSVTKWSKRGLRRRRLFEKGLSTVLFLSLTDRQGESVCLNSSFYRFLRKFLKPVLR